MSIRLGSDKRSSGGPLVGGCALWFAALAIWGVSALIFPKMPGYTEALQRGDVVQGEVIRVETIENVTINSRHPRRVVFRYGEGEEASMAMALNESATKGQALKVRLLGEHAYPEGIRPLERPSWLNLALIGSALLGTLLLGFGVLRLLVIAGVLFAAGRAMLKKEN